MARLSHADQNRFSVPRFDSGRALGSRPRAVHGPGAAFRHARHSGMALVLLQSSHARPGPVSRARYLHPAHEAEKHPPLDARRRSDHALGPGVLRLIPGIDSMSRFYWLETDPRPAGAVNGVITPWREPGDGRSSA